MDWQGHYAAGDLPWDEGGPHPELVDFVEKNGPLQGRVLVPGCGRGHEVRALSTSGNEVIGLDIAPGAVEIASQLPKAGREQYIAGDLFNLDTPLRQSFDWVVEHTCFCAIDPTLRPAYPAAIAGALKPDGHLLAVFYLRPAADRQPPYGATIAELDSLFTPYFDVLREWVPARTFEDREGRELVRLCRVRGGLHL